MKKYFFWLLIFALTACQPKHVYRLSSVETDMLPVDSTLDAIQDSAYLAYLAPISADLQEKLDIPLGTAPETLTTEGVEGRLMNWASDALMAKAVQLYSGHVDCAIVNRHGIRCSWTAGDITFRQVFEMMPFDNELVVLTLNGEDMLELADSFARRGGEGNSKEFRMEIRDGHAENVTIGGKPVKAEQVYYVATSDYLSGGADGMTALTHYTERWKSKRKIRELYMEYIQEIGVVEAQLDGRTRVK